MEHMFEYKRMRSLCFLLAPLLCCLPTQARPAFFVGASLTPQVRRQSALSAVQYRLLKVAGVKCHVVEIDLSNPHVRLQAVRAADMGSRYQTFGSFVRHHRPLAAVTGTFFDTATGTIICNLVREGRLLEMGSVGHTLALDDSNQARMFWTAGSYGGGRKWKDSEFAVSSGPSLVRGGQICLDPSSEGFSDPGLFRHASRAGLALMSSGKLLMVSVNQGITLGKFAQVMKEMGAQDALNLDGGSSTALYARGQFHSLPGRRLTNVLMVTVRPGAPLPQEVELEALQAVEESAEPVVSGEDVPAPEPDQVNLDSHDIWL